MRTIKFRADYNGINYEVETKVPLHKDAKGWHKRQGYIVCLTKNHPYADKRGYVLEHRLVMEQHLGRFLTDNEIIHHKDGNRENNDLTNLQLMDDQKVHAGIEITGKRNDNGQIVAQEQIFDDIKFRLFNKNTNLVEIFTLSKLIGTTFRRGQFGFRGRYTGLLDKNGKEIYEGDILKDETKNGGITSVFWNAAGFEIYKSYDELNNRDEGIRFGYWVKEAMDKIEVIGNIFENPELLKVVVKSKGE